MIPTEEELLGMTTPPTTKRIDNGGPAFPFVDGYGGLFSSGMSLRAWLAGQALMGYRASETDPTIAKMPGSVVARAALADADALLAALTEGDMP